MRRSVVTILVLVVLAFGLVAANGALTLAKQGTPPAETTASVTREILGAGEPAAAPGETLELVRYTIPPRFQIAPHTHPGMQVNQIVSGELTYTVVDGEISITRAATAGTPGPMETLGSGQTTVFRPGDSFVEAEGMVHFAENAGTEPVVILTASLFASGEPPSSVVAVATPTG
jgi:quercetin dioxygenase-like cupin family protein